MAGLTPSRTVVIKCAAFFAVMILLTSAAALLTATRTKGATWPMPVEIDTGASFCTVDLGIGANGMYVLSWIYSAGPVILYRSTDRGDSWSYPLDVFNLNIQWAAPGMCVYDKNGVDNIIVGSAPGIMSISEDNGATFRRLPDLPLPVGVTWWRYFSIGTNASWFGVPPDDDLFVAASMYVGQPWTGVHAMGFVKSTDGGQSWHEPTLICQADTTTYWPQLLCDGQTLYVFYTRLKSDLSFEALCMKSSHDWGNSWSNETRLPTPPIQGRFVKSVQHLDNSRAMMVCLDQAASASDVKMIYGYFHYDTLSFEELGSEAGDHWNFLYSGLSAHLTQDNEFMLAYVDSPSSGDDISLRFTTSTDTGLSRVISDPRILTRPSTLGYVAENYSFHATVTPADNGTLTYRLATDVTWLSLNISDHPNCTISGVPDHVGVFWANLTVSDDNSSDHVNWTITVWPERVIRWSPPVTVSPTAIAYFGLDLGFGNRDTYALSWVNSSGPVYLFKSGDNGTSWSQKDLFGHGMSKADPGMCVYENGTHDTILVASGPGYVLRSENGGETFSYLSNLPTSLSANSWRYLSIGTNASWFGRTPDSDIYVVGSRYITWPSPMYVVTFTMSRDNGTSWSSPVIVTDITRETAFAELVSDGSSLCVVYSAMLGDHTDLYVRRSNDWGRTWSNESVLVSRGPSSEWLCTYSLQPVDEKKALITFAEYGSSEDPAADSIGRFGYLAFSDLKYYEVGGCQGPDWMISGGFAGRLKDDTNFTVAWLKETNYPQNRLMFTYATDSGLGGYDHPPKAMISAEPTMGPPGTEFVLNASGCRDLEDAADALEVRWDFEGDGVWDTDWSTEKAVAHTYTDAGEFNATVQVRDSKNQTDNATVLVIVSDVEIPELSGALVPIVAASLLMAVIISRSEGRKRRA
jgi:hypothetical protein